MSFEDFDSSSSADIANSSIAHPVVSQLHDLDDKVNTMRNRIKNDPDDLVDKLIKLALPALAGLIISKLAEIGWKAAKSSILGKLDVSYDPDHQGLVETMFFSATMGALGTLVSAASTKSSDMLVDARHRKHSPNSVTSSTKRASTLKATTSTTTTSPSVKASSTQSHSRASSYGKHRRA